MPTVEQVIGWLQTLPPQAEFVAWWNGREYEVNQVGHAADDATGEWTKAGVFLGDRIKKRKTALRPVD